MLKLARRARGHFVTLIEIRVHLIRVKPGHISINVKNLESQLCRLWRIEKRLLSSISGALTLWRPNRPKPARLSILLCPTPDDFTRQWGTPGSQWVKCSAKWGKDTFQFFHQFCFDLWWIGLDCVLCFIVNVFNLQSSRSQDGYRTASVPPTAPSRVCTILSLPVLLH